MKETSSLGDLFLFRESEKRLKTTRGGSFFVNVLPTQKSDKSILETFVLWFNDHDYGLETTQNVFMFKSRARKISKLSSNHFLGFNQAQKNVKLISTPSYCF